MIIFAKGRGRGRRRGRGGGRGRGGRDDTRTVEELLEDISFQEEENGVCCYGTSPEMLKLRVSWGAISGRAGRFSGEEGQDNRETLDG